MTKGPEGKGEIDWRNYLNNTDLSKLLGELDQGLLKKVKEILPTRLADLLKKFGWTEIPTHEFPLNKEQQTLDVFYDGTVVGFQLNKTSSSVLGVAISPGGDESAIAQREASSHL